jgi:serine/threonine protein kinase
LKPHNILLASEQKCGEEKKFRLLLSNFWFARYVPPVETVNSIRGVNSNSDSGAGHSYGEGGCLTKCGSLEFMAPEIHQLIPYGTSVDMWSAGCLFYMLIAGNTPFMQSDLSENIRTILSGEFNFDDKCWEHISISFKRMIVNLLRVDTSLRWTAKQALEQWEHCLSATDLQKNDLSM